MPITSLYRAERVRIDVSGTPTLDGLSFVSTADRLVIVGSPRVLFEASIGVLGIDHGLIEVGGRSPRAAVRARIASSVPRDPKLPPRWTLGDYVCWSARLSGLSAGDATSATRRVLETAPFASAPPVPLKSASHLIRRLAPIAAARAIGAEIFIIEDPFVGLADDLAHVVGEVLAEASLGKRIVFFSRALDLTLPVVASADDVIVISGSHVIARGTPAHVSARTRTFSLKVVGEAGRFSALAGERGILLDGSGESWTVTLIGDQTTNDVLSLALEARSAVVELVPVSPLR